MTYKSSLLLVVGLVLAACAGGNSSRPFGNSGSNGFGNPAYPVGSPGYVFSTTVGDRVFFAVDQSVLRPGARRTLIGQARWLLENQGYEISIEGHADEQGTREYNLALGARRASAVQQFLITQGVAPVRIRTVTYGKERPVEICSAESCYAKNRRAVTVLNAAAIN